MSKVLMKGNEAFAEAAIRAGCKCYFGYPITPQNEIPEYMSHELPKAGGAFLQAESELAAVNMAFGAAASGGRVFISTSSPGLALMQEGLGFICSAEVPVVVLNVSRGGPGVGGIQRKDVLRAETDAQLAALALVPVEDQLEAFLHGLLLLY